MTAFLVSVLAVITVTSLWHGFTEHHWHRQAWRVFDKDAYVPQPRHDTRWHGMSHPRRMFWMLVLGGAAALLAAGWHWQPKVTVVTAGLGAFLAVVVPAARAAARSAGARHPAAPSRHRKRGS